MESKLFKRLFSMCIVIAMVLSMCPTIVFAESTAEEKADPNYCPHCDTVLSDADWTNLGEYITAFGRQLPTGHYRLYGDYTVPEDHLWFEDSATVVIDLNGYTLSPTEGKRTICVDTGRTLYLLNSAGDTDAEGNVTGLVQGGTLESSSASTYGGAIYVSGTLYMYGGTVSGGRIVTTKAGSGARHGYGGNIYISSSGKMEMFGGTVSEGYVQTIHAYNNTSATATYAGSGAYGGNIYVDGSLVINDGTISGGTCASTVECENTYCSAGNAQGGNIYGKALTIRGGLITEGVAIEGGNIMSTSAFELSGTAKVTNGRTTAYAGNIYFSNNAGTRVIGGNAEVSGGISSSSTGGNIYMTGTNTKLTVKDNAVISEGSATGGGNIAQNTGSTLVIAGGIIKDGTATATENWGGGNIQVFRSKLIMTGGVLSGGKAENVGNSIYIRSVEYNNYVYYARFYGGTILPDTTENTKAALSMGTGVADKSDVYNLVTYEALSDTIIAACATKAEGTDAEGNTVYTVYQTALDASGTCTAETACGHTYSATACTNADCGKTHAPIVYKACESCGATVPFAPYTDSYLNNGPIFSHYYLVEDVTLTEEVALTAGMSVCIDMNGYDMTTADVSRGIRVTEATLNITNTSAETSELKSGGGGVIYTTEAQVSLKNITVSGGEVGTGSNGGSICLNTDSTIVIDNCIITGGTAGKNGGNICCYNSDITIKGNTTIEKGSASNNGDDIYMGSASTLVMYDGTVTDICYLPSTGSVHMYGGTIEKVLIYNYGSYKASFYMYGGTVDNLAVSGKTKNDPGEGVIALYAGTVGNDPRIANYKSTTMVAACSCVIVNDDGTYTIIHTGGTATCENCSANDIYEGGYTFPEAFVGSHTYEYTSNNDATCEADGTKHGVCSNCGNEVDVADEGSKLGHDYAEEWSKDDTHHWHACANDAEHKDSYAEHVYVYANSGVGTCVCGATKDCEHTYEYTSNNDATCEADGTKHGVCSNCGNEVDVADEGSKLDHDYAEEWSKNDTHHWHACANDAEHKADYAEHVYVYANTGVGTCVCDATVACDHNWEVTGSTAGDCKTPGTTSYECSVCHMTKTENGAFGDHDMSEPTGYDANCTDAGFKALAMCLTCEDYFEDAEGNVIGDYDAAVAWMSEGGAGHIPASGHAYSYTSNGDGTHNGVCGNNCGIADNGTCDEAGTDGACSKCGYVAKIYVAEVNGTKYTFIVDALEAADDGDTVILLADVTLDTEVTLTDMSLTITGDYTLDANDKLTLAGTVSLNAPKLTGDVKAAANAVIKDTNIGGYLYLNASDSNLTFQGDNKVDGFSASYYNNVITIGAGAYLEITGSNRLTIGWGNTFNITGTITDAKTADKSAIKPSLKVAAGITVNGSSAKTTLNVTNAYIVFSSTCGTNKNASGGFVISFTNSIADLSMFKQQYAIGTYDVDFVDSVINVAKNLTFLSANAVVDVDNSQITVGSSFGNAGTFTLKNGSVMNVSAMVNTTENGTNSGLTIVDNATLNATGTSIFKGYSTGVLKVVNGGTANINKITDATVSVDVDSTVIFNSIDSTNAIEVDVADFAEAVTVIEADLSGYTGQIALDNNNGTIIYEANANGLTVKKAVASVNGVAYESLQEAIDAAVTANGGIVKVLGNITVDETVVVSKATNMQVWLNLNGFTVTGEGNADPVIKNNGFMMITGGTVKSTVSGGTAIESTNMLTTFTGAVFDAGNDGYALVSTGSMCSVSGTFIGKISIDMEKHLSASYGTPIKDGIFSEAPAAEHIGATKVAVLNADGMYELADAVASVGNVGYATLQEAIDAAGEGDTVKLLSDVTITELIKIEEAITLDLGGNKVTATSKKAFEVYANATIMNGTIEAAQRCVDTRKAVELTLTDVNLIADKYTSYGNPQPLTIGGSENGTKVNMTNVNISAEKGYGIITFVKTQLNATGCTISGYNALYVKPGSEESVFNFNDCDLTGSTTSNDVEGNSFSTIAVRADDVTVNVDADSTVSANGNYCWAISLDSKFTGESGITGANITVAGTINGKVLDSADVDNNTITVKAEYAAQLQNAGYGAVIANGMATAVVAVASVNGTYYATLAEAVAAANDGDTVKLLSDVTITELIKIEEAITLDLGGKTITANCRKAIEVYADATITNGTIIANERCVDTRKAVELTLTNVNLLATQYKGANQQPLTIGGSENGTVVNLNNVTIDAGTQGYAIITFVETEMNAVDSNISGYMALYVKDGSEGSEFNFENSTLTSDITGNDVVGNTSNIIAVETDNVSVNLDGGALVAKGNNVVAIDLRNVTGAELVIKGDIDAPVILKTTDVENNTISVKAEYADDLVACGYVALDNGDGTVTAHIHVYESQYFAATNTENAYTVYTCSCGDTYTEVEEGTMLHYAVNEQTGESYGDLQAALNAASKGDTVKLLKDAVEGDVYVGAQKTLDLNGHKLTAETVSASFSTSYIIDNTNGEGLLAVDQANISLNSKNTQLPLWTNEGARFVTVTFGQALDIKADKEGVANNMAYYRFAFNETADNTILDEYLANGTEGTSVSIRIKATWENANGTVTQYFTYNSELVEKYVNQNNGWDANMFMMNLTGVANVENASFAAEIVSTANAQATVVIASVPLS